MRCERCDCRLARDQTGLVCSPCERARFGVEAEADAAITRSIERRHARADEAHQLGLLTIRQAERWLMVAIRQREQEAATLVARLDRLSDAAAEQRRADLRLAS